MTFSSLNAPTFKRKSVHKPISVELESRSLRRQTNPIVMKSSMSQDEMSSTPTGSLTGLHVNRIYLVTYRYDLANLMVCLASIRYWHPEVEIVIVKNQNCGSFDISFLQKHYRVSFLQKPSFTYGKFFGSLEPVLSGAAERFLCLDTDTALTGPLLQELSRFPEDFIVDREETTPEKLRTLYWDPDRISQHVEGYTPLWFAFNNGIFCGRGDRITVSDFEGFMEWRPGTEPRMKDECCFPMSDQSAINVVLNIKSQNGQTSVRREHVMIYPPFYGGSEDELLAGIMSRQSRERRAIHWADQKSLPLDVRPLAKVYQFYFNLFLADFSKMGRIRIKSLLWYLSAERALRHMAGRVLQAVRSRIRQRRGGEKASA